MPDLLPENIFNTNKVDYANTSLFLGEKNGMFDLIHRKYPKLWSLYKTLKTQDWDENEISVSSCLSEFKTCDKSTYDIMIKTLAWQWEADSVAAHCVVPLFAPFVTSDELWPFILRYGDNECLTGDHEVLTPAGWKRIDQVTMVDRVAQWDYTSRGIDFVEPADIIAKPYNGTMFNFYGSNGNVSQITTEDHRMPVIYPYWTNEGQPEFKYAKDVKYHGGNGLPTAGYIVDQGRRMSPQERLYVAVQADGSLCSEKYTGSNTGHKHYRFSFSKPRKIERFLSLCEQAGWAVTELSITTREPGYRTFIAYVPIQDYNDQAKTFDWFSLDQIDYSWSMDFLDEIKYWDGNVTPGGRTRYTSTNKSCVDKVVALAHLTGNRGHVTTIPARNDVLMPSGNLCNTITGYQVHITDRPYVTGNSIIKNEFDFEGNVYCLTVPTGYFLVRHNGAVTVTGNCLHSATYSEIVRNSFDDPSVVLNEVLSISESMGRLTVVGNVFNYVKEVGLKVETGEISRTSDVAYEAVILLVCTLFSLERIQFMSSFAVTFGICKTGRFMPIGKNVQKIASDELDIHVELHRTILHYERQTARFQRIWPNLKPRVKNIVDEITGSELEWNKYLFSEGRELTGFTTKVLDNWSLFNAGDVYSELDIDCPWEIPSKNPLKFMEDWLDINKTQSSPMEEDTNNYRINTIVRDDEDKVFDL